MIYFCGSLGPLSASDGIFFFPVSALMVSKLLLMTILSIYDWTLLDWTLRLNYILVQPHKHVYHMINKNFVNVCFHSWCWNRVCQSHIQTSLFTSNKNGLFKCTKRECIWHLCYLQQIIPGLWFKCWDSTTILPFL